MRFSRKRPLVATAFLSLLVLACGKPADEHQYALRGQVISVAPNRQEITIKHEEIKGLMAAMTMPYKVSSAKLLDGVAPGDLITATLVVVSGDGRLTRITKVGKAPLEEPAARSPSGSLGADLPALSGAVPGADVSPEGCGC
jgi:Cu/Ag efflux protein CusF